MYLTRGSGRKGQANSYGEGKRGRGGSHDGFQGMRRTLCVPSAGAEMAGEAEAGASLHNHPGSQRGPWRSTLSLCLPAPLADMLEVARELPSGCPWSCRPVSVASIHPIPPSAQEHQGEFPTLGALGLMPGAAGSQRASEPFPRAG